MPPLRKALPYLWVVVILAFLRLAWVEVSRRAATARMEAALEEKRARPYRDFLGDHGPGVRILHFYASPGELVGGARAVMCYGVQNARSVRLEPPVEEITPSLNRCFSIAPAASTSYTLKAEGLDGSQASASITVTVKAKRGRPHSGYRTTAPVKLVRLVEARPTVGLP